MTLLTDGQINMLNKLSEDTEIVLKKAYKNRKNINGAINWADLSCVNVGIIMGYSYEALEVVIEEAAPDSHELQKYVRDELKKKGYDDSIYVTTEW